MYEVYLSNFVYKLNLNLVQVDVLVLKNKWKSFKSTKLDLQDRMHFIFTDIFCFVSQEYWWCRQYTLCAHNCFRFESWEYWRCRQYFSYHITRVLAVLVILQVFIFVAYQEDISGATHIPSALKKNYSLNL
jgi:hypothetical protein